MEILFYLFAVIILAYLLSRAADLIEDSFVYFAHRLRISTFVIGFLAVSIASSLPEISVSITSSINGVPSLSVGHMLGASLILITMILGINTILHKKVPFKGSFGAPQIILTAIVLGCQIVAIYDRNLTQVEGIFLILLYVIFAAYITTRSSRSSVEKHKTTKLNRKIILSSLAKSLVGIAGLVICSVLIVESATNLALAVGIPNAVVGLLVLALGTNVPELVIMLRSQGTESGKLVTGNLMGSASLNTGTLGLIGVLAPHHLANYSALIPVMTMLGLSLIIFAYLAYTGKELTYREGGILVGLYLAFLVAEGLPILRSL